MNKNAWHKKWSWEISNVWSFWQSLPLCTNLEVVLISLFKNALMFHQENKDSMRKPNKTEIFLRFFSVLASSRSISSKTSASNFHLGLSSRTNSSVKQQKQGSVKYNKINSSSLIVLTWRHRDHIRELKHHVYANLYHVTKFFS